MVFEALRRLTSGPKPVVAVFGLLLTSLYLLSAATHDSGDFGRMYSLLLVINIAALLLLLTLISRQLLRLVRQYREQAPGARLTGRLVAMFVVLAVVPVSVVYYFSLQYLHRGIDSWFDVKVERALEDALALGQTSLQSHVRELLRSTRAITPALEDIPQGMAALELNEQRRKASALEMTLLTHEGRVVATAAAGRSDIVPAIPNSAVLIQLRQGIDYVALEPVDEETLQVRIAVPVENHLPGADFGILHAIYPVGARVTGLAESVQSAYSQYKELSYLRQPLKYSFTLTLSLVLLLSLLTAVWAAFSSARRLVAPIRDLAEGTRAVAAGDYDKRLPLPSRDELGFLVRSFNEMTRKIALSRDEAKRSQSEVEAQRTYLEVVLGRLSSGVMTVNREQRIRTVNDAAVHILRLPQEALLNLPVEDLERANPGFEPLVSTILPRLEETGQEWRAEVVLFGPGGRQVLMCRGSALPEVGDIEGGHLIVFDDVTALIQAQRDAAWGEVARRLAHEIKNPLTPIQLSAERLRHKYLNRMSPEDAEVLDRSTHTIVQQVEAMKDMVRAFSDYARTPLMQTARVNLNTLVDEVLDLYRGEGSRLRILSRLDPAVPRLEADSGRLRQLLHNLIKNAVEAGDEAGTVRLEVTTRCMEEHACRYVELRIRDDGPGIPPQMLAQLFEPYVTTKPRGTGLGLAIVKKIVEEHGGMLWANNPREGGAAITIRLPVHPAEAMSETE